MLLTLGIKAAGAHRSSPFRLRVFYLRLRDMVCFEKIRRSIMSERTSSTVLAVAMAAAVMTIGGVAASQDAKYPDWKGQWSRVVVPGVGGQGAFDQTKPWGLGQQAPLTAEYQKVLEDSMADQAKGGLGNYPTARCLPSGMPRMMTFGSHEYVITPETTFILLEWDHDRRIFTDGRDWPREIEPTYGGYSIGKWVDQNGDGRYDTLEVETRGFKGPRAYDASGLPLHVDNQSVFLEKFHLDEADPNILHDEITVIDHALTRPWIVDKRYRRTADPHARWPESYCTEGNNQVAVGTENYFLSGDGLLMPTRKDQAPPDLRYFKQSRK
jgi:hypothetical protein